MRTMPNGEPVYRSTAGVKAQSAVNPAELAEVLVKAYQAGHEAGRVEAHKEIAVAFAAVPNKATTGQAEREITPLLSAMLKSDDPITVQAAKTILGQKPSRN